jgi:hypothetical protein
MNASRRIDKQIADRGIRQGQTLAAIRRTTLQADKQAIEEWK